jgi:hypothetical protein
MKFAKVNHAQWQSQGGKHIFWSEQTPTSKAPAIT